MANQQGIRKRIKSVNSTKKITGAMEMIANAKLFKYRASLHANNDYSKKLEEIVNQIFANIDPELEYGFLEKRKTDKKVYFVFTSDLGLCGGYNINIYKYIKAHVSKDDEIYMIGEKEYGHVSNDHYNVVNIKEGSDGLNYDYLAKIIKSYIVKYQNNEIGGINVIYTKYINTVTFETDCKQLLPIENKDIKKTKEVDFDPGVNESLDFLIPYYITNTFYNCYLQTKTSEYGSRRFAMENATDNANEIVDKLTIEYNQARQASITQEITEIIGGSSAL